MSLNECFSFLLFLLLDDKCKNKNQWKPIHNYCKFLFLLSKKLLHSFIAQTENAFSHDVCKVKREKNIFCPKKYSIVIQFEAGKNKTIPLMNMFYLGSTYF